MEVPPVRERAPRKTRYRYEKKQYGYICAWVLLAQSSKLQSLHQAQNEQGILEKEAGN